MKARGGSPAGAPMAAAFVARKLLETDAAITAAVPRVLAESDDEAIHDLRVAIRRLRTLLAIARKLFGRWHTDVVRRAYAEVMRATGELRDEEVLEETLEGTSEAPTFATWLSGRAARERRLRAAVVERIERGELDRARLLLKALLVFPVNPADDRELARFARRTVERARLGVEERREVATEDVLGLHELRIAYKKLRYAIELLAEALPIDARAMLEPATVFQKRLGEIHDVDVAVSAVTSAKGLDAAAKAEAIARLAQKRSKRIAKYVRELDPLADLIQPSETPGASAPSPGPATEEAGDDGHSAPPRSRRGGAG